MECRDPHVGRFRPNDVLNSLPHFGSGFVGEGNRQNLGGADRLRFEHIRDTAGENSRFTGTGSSHDEEWGATMLDGLLLLGIEPLE